MPNMHSCAVLVDRDAMLPGISVQKTDFNFIIYQYQARLSRTFLRWVIFDPNKRSALHGSTMSLMGLTALRQETTFIQCLTKDVY